MTPQYNKTTNAILIPNNHRIVRYSEFFWTDELGIEHLLYEPVYERVHKIRKVYYHKLGQQLVYLINDDGEAYDATGNRFNVAFDNLAEASSHGIEEFFTKLAQNEFAINEKGELQKLSYYFPLYTINTGFMVAQCKFNDASFQLHRKWGEIFTSRQVCADWCNRLNKMLKRDYPTVE